jgi:hypothetical protein
MYKKIYTVEFTVGLDETRKTITFERVKKDGNEVSCAIYIDNEKIEIGTQNLREAINGIHLFK